MWEILAALVGSLLPMLFGGSNADRSTTSTGTTSTTTPAWKPKDPGYAMLSPALLSILMQNYGRLSGAGFPGGKGIGGDWTSGIVDTLKNAQGDIFNAYNAPAAPVAQTPVQKAEEIVKQITRKSLRKP